MDVRPRRHISLLSNLLKMEDQFTKSALILKCILSIFTLLSVSSFQERFLFIWWVKSIRSHIHSFIHPSILPLLHCFFRLPSQRAEHKYFLLLRYILNIRPTRLLTELFSTVSSIIQLIRLNSFQACFTALTKVYVCVCLPLAWWL